MLGALSSLAKIEEISVEKPPLEVFQQNDFNVVNLYNA